MMLEEDSSFPMKGKNRLDIQAAIKKFEQERDTRGALRRMKVEADPSAKSHLQKQLLTIKCNKPPYRDRLVRIMVWFSDDFPFAPPRLFMEPLGPDRTGFLHPNVYQDSGKVCHHLLIPLKYGNKHITLATIFENIESMLYEPCLKDPANFGLANVHKNDRERYQQLVEENAALLQLDPDCQSDSSDSQVSNCSQ